MNTNFLSVLKKIAAEQGEAILADPQRLKGLISDYAKDEPRAERLAFGRCIEYGANTELKNAPASGRAAVKNRLAQRLHSGEGLDTALCAGALDLLEAALWGIPEQKNLCPGCRKELQAGWSACPYCGARTAQTRKRTYAYPPSGSPGAGYGIHLIESPPSALPAAAVNAPETIPISESEKKRNSLIETWSWIITLIIFFALPFISSIASWPIFDNIILSLLIAFPGLFIIFFIVETIMRKIIGKKPE
ncbi:MAG: zinc ribbon domain-containing protein [Spirochaetaceae bacterium]|jgi:hypothetical protein|nr:zinc ribbon domain-containing protein [Spirochaetaceae bacterium]